MANPSVTYTFTNGTTADGTQVNQNFTDLINSLTDGTKTLTISALTCGSTVTMNGGVILGASSSNTIVFNGSVASSIPVSSNTAWDFGSSTLGMKSYYIGGTGSFTTRLMGSATSSYTITLPAAAPGTAHSLIESDTSGNLSFTATPTVTSITIGSASLTYNSAANQAGLVLSAGNGLFFPNGNTIASISGGGGGRSQNARHQIC